MQRLEERTRCLEQPWTTHLNSELQFANTGPVREALTEALVGVGYAWADARQRGFHTERAHSRRRERALNLSRYIQSAYRMPSLQVWGLALNV